MTRSVGKSDIFLVSLPLITKLNAHVIQWAMETILQIMIGVIYATKATYWLR